MKSTWRKELKWEELFNRANLTLCYRSKGLYMIMNQVSDEDSEF